MLMANKFHLNVSKCTPAPGGLKPCALIACGSFSPITYFHLRLFEDSRDAIASRSGMHVIGGFLSAVHDDYTKQGLIPYLHRSEMNKLAVQDSDWVASSEWEGQQKSWTHTVDVLDAHCALLKSAGYPSIKMILLCGADVLNAFSDPNIWPRDQVQRIVSDHGVAVMEREGFDIDKIIGQDPVLRNNRKNIYRIPRVVVNDISSTIVRKLISSRRSVKYLIPNLVISYIAEHSLFL
uniref:Nicotinamide-nucleotide adenylyltransferase n=1 Tax=Spongospora subterranea TaxID=70186 RepID=A0A0H5R5V9_9EUKA|eukprot:CRZ09241.1 hypothetical protein [Spongospora subterranea]